MNPKQLLGAALLLLGVVGLVVAGQRVATRSGSEGTQGAGKPASEAAAESCQAIVYYLHTNEHCVTCDRIKALTEKTMAEEFGDELASGLMEFRIRNVDEPANEHYWDEFQMDAATVVVQAQTGEKRFENLSQVWMLNTDETAFRDYLRTHIRGFLPKADARATVQDGE